MGKEIVRAQSNEPGEREFLVDSKDICDVLEDNTGTKNVLGISLDVDETDELHIHESAFKQMRNLLFLKFYTKEQKEVRLHSPEGFDYLPPKLRLLSWANYPLRSMPSKFLPQNLVTLDMKYSKLEKLWDGVHSLAGLKNMNLLGSKNLKEIPNLSMATNLEKLVLSYCSCLVELPSFIQHLNKLKDLLMRDCKNLEILPTGINLQSLNFLDLIGCSRLRSFPDISSNISTLSLYGTSIEEFPSNLRLENLYDFRMYGMRSEKLGIRLQHFMEMLSPTLTELDLLNIPSLVELPSSFQTLHKLKYLSITNCINLETLPTCINLESLNSLDLSGCSQLKSFPDISTNIQHLNLSQTGIEEVPWWIEKFSKLTYLTMCGCKRLQSVSLNISKMKDLSRANFSDCRALYRVLRDDDASSSFPDNHLPKVEFRFTNCVNLDQEALLQQPSLSFKRLILSGEEMPSYFTHQTTKISLTNIPLLHTSLSQRFFKFKACAVVIFDSKSGSNGVTIHVNCRFKGKFEKSFDSFGPPESFRTTKKDSYLLIFECHILLPEDNALLPQLNYDHVDMEIHVNDCTAKLKGWGICLFKDCSSSLNSLGYPNTLLHICETDDDSVCNETEHSEERGGNDVVPEKSSKRMRIT
ncbi:Disease resistance protein RPS6 [Cardamine amara subsp. amara]|uniref:Disease resistance protein RPS6 n=1 Tax=Cardamine amara subsp. amara TaxID=228776 RepID=A0ABD1C3H7_CARAN